MQFTITREAVCAQDDQIGSLEITLELDALSSIQDLTNAIHQARFLQFSTSHTTMLGTSGEVKIVKVAEQNLGKMPDEYLVSADSLSHQFIKNGCIHFTFVR